MFIITFSKVFLNKESNFNFMSDLNCMIINFP